MSAEDRVRTSKIFLGVFVVIESVMELRPLESEKVILFVYDGRIMYYLIEC